MLATTTPDLAEAICGLVDRAGVADLFTGVELTTTDPLMLAEDPEACREELDAVVWRCLAAGAQRVVIGGGPLSDAATLSGRDRRTVGGRCGSARVLPALLTSAVRG
ncbi:hypothetical protein [Corynebacterium variabile]|uniref:hypothetical protein n=1 Tax=Corynebacterium variabile TaxID=1727 RepID=UPI003FD436F3